MRHNENSGKKTVHSTMYLYKDLKLGLVEQNFNPNTMEVEAGQA